MKKHVLVSVIFALIVSVLMVAGVMKVTRATEDMGTQRRDMFRQCVNLGGSAPDCAEAVYGRLPLRE